MNLRFGIDGRTEEKTQKEVAVMLGISQSYISRLEKRIIKKLQNKLTKQMYIFYMLGNTPTRKWEIIWLDIKLKLQALKQQILKF